MKRITLPLLLTLSAFFLFACTPTAPDIPAVASEEEATAATEPLSTEEAAATTEETKASPEMTAPELDTESLCYQPFFPVAVKGQEIFAGKQQPNMIHFLKK